MKMGLSRVTISTLKACAPLLENHKKVLSYCVQCRHHWNGECIKGPSLLFEVRILTNFQNVTHRRLVRISTTVCFARIQSFVISSTCPISGPMPRQVNKTPFYYFSSPHALKYLNQIKSRVLLWPMQWLPSVATVTSLRFLDQPLPSMKLQQNRHKHQYQEENQFFWPGLPIGMSAWR